MSVVRAGPGSAPVSLDEFLRAHQVEGSKASTHTCFGDTFGAYYISAADSEAFLDSYVDGLFSGGGAGIGLVERHRDLGPVVIDLDLRYRAGARESEQRLLRGAAAEEGHSAFGRGGGRVGAAEGGVARHWSPGGSGAAGEEEGGGGGGGYAPSGGAGADAGSDAPEGRRHDRRLLRRFVISYFRELAKWVALPREGLEVFVMEKPLPVFGGGVIKDGVHIVVPDAVTHPRVQHLVRRAFLPALAKVFQELGHTNTVEDVFDESVLQRNGWMMYGASKPGQPPYDVVEVVRVVPAPEREGGWDSPGLEQVAFRRPRTPAEVRALVSRLSLRNKDEELPLLPGRVEDVDKAMRLESKAREQIRTNPMLNETVTARAGAAAEDLELAQRLVALLDSRRADAYQSWMRVGWCLHNIDHRMLREWEEFSRRSNKHEPGLCEQLWEHMVIQKEGGLGLGSLHRWAREDAPMEFERMARDRMCGKVRVAMSGTHHDVAVVIWAMYNERFVCSSVSRGIWYEFRDHRWSFCDSGVSLRRLLPVDVGNRFLDEAARCGAAARQIRSGDGPEAAAEHDRLTNMAAKLTDVARKLKSISFKEAVMKELRELMYRSNFESNLDSKPHLVGFENGVYDLQMEEFRAGAPEDMLSFSTHVDYIAFDPEAAMVREIMGFFSQIQPNARVREYMLRMLGSFINGSIREEKFRFWTGVGSNGKSITVDLFERAFGDYCAKLPVSLITQRRAQSNSATSEVARLKGKRFACLQEPGHDEVLNVGLMKELTGGDRIMARALYQEPIEFRPQMKLIMVCNTLPEVPSDDHGTWRRLEATKFDSKFVECPDPGRPNEFLLDDKIIERLDGWAPYLMGMLVHYHSVYQRLGNKAPPEVLEPTRLYRQSQDVVQQFIDERLEVGPERTIEIETMYDSWKEFVRAAGFASCPIVKRHDFVMAIVRHLPGATTLHNRLLRGAARRVRPPPGTGEGTGEEGEEAGEEAGEGARGGAKAGKQEEPEGAYGAYMGEAGQGAS